MKVEMNTSLMETNIITCEDCSLHADQPSELEWT